VFALLSRLAGDLEISVDGLLIYKKNQKLESKVLRAIFFRRTARGGQTASEIRLTLFMEQ